MQGAQVWAVGAAAIAAIGLTLGCSSNTTSSPPTTTTTTTTTAPSNKTIAIDTPDGQASVSLDGKLPPNWPSSFPVPPGATPAGSGSIGDSTNTVMVGVYGISGSAEDAFNFYKNNSSLTVSNPSSAGVGPLFAGRLTLGGQYAGSVTVGGFSGQTLLVIVLKSPGAGSGGTVATTAPASGTTSGTSQASATVAPGTTVAP
jgi:hypothetical protein